MTFTSVIKNGKFIYSSDYLRGGSQSRQNIIPFGFNHLYPSKIPLLSSGFEGSEGFIRIIKILNEATVHAIKQ